MKNLRRYLPVLFLSLFLLSCGEDEEQEPEVNCSDPSSLNASAQNVIDLATQYSSDPTNTSLCNDYFQAVDTYINELDAFIRACDNSGVGLTQWEAAIQQWRDTLQLITC